MLSQQVFSAVIPRFFLLVPMPSSPLARLFSFSEKASCFGRHCWRWRWWGCDDYSRENIRLNLRSSFFIWSNMKLREGKFCRKSNGTFIAISRMKQRQKVATVFWAKTNRRRLISRMLLGQIINYGSTAAVASWNNTRTATDGNCCMKLHWPRARSGTNTAPGGWVKLAQIIVITKSILISFDFGFKLRYSWYSFSRNWKHVWNEKVISRMILRNARCFQG